MIMEIRTVEKIESLLRFFDDLTLEEKEEVVCCLKEKCSENAKTSWTTRQELISCIERLSPENAMKAYAILKIVL